MTTRRAFVLGSAAALATLPAPVPVRFNLGRFTRTGRRQGSYSARCLDLIRRATVVDMLSPISLSGRTSAALLATGRNFPSSEVDRFRGSGIDVFHMAVGWGGPDAYADAMQYFMAHNALIAARPDVFLRIDTAEDIARAQSSGRIGILLGAQNSDHFIKPGLNPRDMLETVDQFFSFGQRVSQLTYNTMTWFGSGSTERVDGGLSDLGVELVQRMNKVGIAVDTAHCGDRTTLDAFELSRKPVLVTHSNARALNPGHPRCKPDEVIRAVGKAGSVFGVTGVRMFVKGSEPTTIEDFLAHIDYVAKMIGVEHVGIGSDVALDGYDDLPDNERKAIAASYKGSYAFRDKIDIDEIAHPKRMFDVTEGLIRHRYTDAQILGILGGNFQRVLGDIWRVGA